MSRVIERKKPGEVFGASALIEEIHERWGDQLKRHHPAAQRLGHGSAAGPPLGRINLVRDGRSYYESLYTVAEEEP